MIKSRLGAEVDSAAIQEILAEKTDWYARCRHCNVELKGSIKDLTTHVCEVKHG